jgi:hypothetical protein
MVRSIVGPVALSWVLLTGAVAGISCAGEGAAEDPRAPVLEDDSSATGGQSDQARGGRTTLGRAGETGAESGGLGGTTGSGGGDTPGDEDGGAEDRITAGAANGGGGASQVTGGRSGNQAGASAAICRKGEPAPSLRCRTQDDCRPGALCTQSFLGPGCGAMLQPLLLCLSDVDCSGDSICLTQPPPPCTFGAPTACGPRCTATSCAADERCGASGRCEPLTCEEGFECGVGQLCDPGDPGSSFRGCRPQSCENDGFQCADDRVCDPQRVDRDVYGCAPKLCSSGDWTCADGLECGAPTAMDAHGCRCTSDTTCNTDQVCGAAGYCEARSCQSDDDCDCGVCANGRCGADFYFCSALVP